MLVRSLWHLDAHRSEIRASFLNVTSDKISLKSLFSLISLGTERIVSTGKVPVSLYQEMRVPYMQGDFGFPVLYGYSLIAITEDGEVCHTMHPHQDHIVVDPYDLTLLPYDIPYKRGTLISNLETACNAYWDAKPKKKDRILIVGFGLIGALTAGWLALHGYQNIKILELNPMRKALAQKLGFALIDSEDLSQEFTLAFHSSGSGNGLQSCIHRMELEGRIIDLSWYGDQSINLHLGHLFHYNRLTIRSSQVSHIPAYLRNKQSPWSRKQLVIEILKDNFWDLYLDHEIPFNQTVDYFDHIRAGEISSLSTIIKY